MRKRERKPVRANAVSNQKGLFLERLWRERRKGRNKRKLSLALQRTQKEKEKLTLVKEREEEGLSRFLEVIVEKKRF